MSETLSVNGIVLFAAPVGDYDKRLILLTKERGRITAFARGARKSKSRLLAAANPFVLGSFEVYEGRSAYNLYQAEVSQYFTDLAKEVPGVYYGYYFLEFADYYAREGVDGSEMVNLLYVTLRAVVKKTVNIRLIRRIFELRLMVINGEYPNVFSCLSCGKSEDLVGFSMKKAGTVCRDCFLKTADAESISATLLYTLQVVEGADLKKLYSFNVKEEVLCEFESFMDRYMDCYIDRKFKSLDILEMMS